MKPLLSFLLFILMIFTGLKCSKKNVSDLPGDQINIKVNEVITKANTSCGSTNPEQSLLWLKDIIVRAEEDNRTKKHLGNYMGKIFLTAYKNKPVFYINMAMGSGGIAAYIYDCSGIAVRIEPADTGFEQVAQKSLIYSNVPI